MASHIMDVLAAPSRAQPSAEIGPGSEPGEFPFLLDQTMMSPGPDADTNEAASGNGQECGEPSNNGTEAAKRQDAGEENTESGEMSVVDACAMELATGLIQDDVRISVILAGAPAPGVDANSREFLQNGPPGGDSLTQGGLVEQALPGNAAQQGDGASPSHVETATEAAAAKPDAGLPPPSKSDEDLPVPAEGTKNSMAAAKEIPVQAANAAEMSKKSIETGGEEMQQEQSVPKLGPVVVRQTRSTEDQDMTRQAGSARELPASPVRTAQADGAGVEEEAGQNTPRDNDSPGRLPDGGGEKLREKAGTARLDGEGQPLSFAEGLAGRKAEMLTGGEKIPASTLPRFERMPDFVDNVGRHVLLLVKGDTKQMTVTLIPGDLGRVVLNCQETRGSVSVVMHAENPAAYSLLQRQEGAVRTVLEQGGFNMAKFEVGTWNERGQEKQSRERQHGADETNEPWQEDDGTRRDASKGAPKGISLVGREGRLWAIA